MIKFSKNSHNSIRIECANDGIFQSMRESFATENPAAKFISSPFVQTKFYAISPLGVFKAGLMKDVYERSKILVGKENIKIDSDLAPIAAPSKIYVGNIPDESEIRSRNSEIELRSQQISAIHRAIRFGRSVIISPTGSGKGMIIFGVIDQLTKLIADFNYVLLTVPNVQLTRQLKEEAIKYGFLESDVIIHDSARRLKVCPADVDLLSSKSSNSPKIVIANRAFLQQKENFKFFINGVAPSAVLVDEVHTVKKAAQFSRLVDNLKTPFKFGFTGTVSSAKYDEYQMKGLIGPIVYEESITNLQNEGILSQIEIWNLVIKYSAEYLRRIGYYDKMRDMQERRRVGKVDKNEVLPQIHTEEFKMIYCNDWMQHVMFELVEKLGTKNTLILYDSTEIGNLVHSELYKRLKYDREVYLINGKTPVETRTQIQKKFETFDRQLLVAQTQTFSTGINIKNIHNIVFAFSSKSFVKIIQSIGRGLRTLENKQFLRLIDISSNLKYSLSHSKIRNELYYDNYGKNHNEIRKLVLEHGQSVDLTKLES
jgi:superfamily II DNA or RNA helicase